MHAITFSNPGPPSVLRLEEIPKPSPGPGEVLVKVAAAGVNRPDIMQRQGLYPAPPGASDILGLEIAGTVVELGGRVTELQRGEEVCALVTGGGYAEYCTASAQLCLPIPEGFDMGEGAALPETFFTVWSNVFQRGGLKSYESFLVHGGTGGIGVTAIQLARAFGSKVYTTAGTDEKCDFCENLGAHAAINYRSEDFVDRIKELSGGKGIDLILDIIGGDYLQRNLSCLAVEGRLVQIAFQQGPKTKINLVPIMLKRLTLTGSTLRARNVDFKAKIGEQLLTKVWPLLHNGSILPVIHSTFPLSKAQDAHSLMETSEHIGKIILIV